MDKNALSLVRDEMGLRKKVAVSKYFSYAESATLLLFCMCLFGNQILFSQNVDILIKGIDDGIASSRQRDFQEAEMNAKLQAIERAGIEIVSITEVVNFELKYDLVQAKAEAVLLPGFKVIDMGYQVDGTYQVVLSGKVQSGNARFGIDKDQLLAIKEKLIPLLLKDQEIARIRNGYERYSGGKFTIPEIIKNIDFTLKLLPKNFDYSSDEIIRKAMAHVQAINLLMELPKLPRGKVTGLTFREGTRGRGTSNPRDIIMCYINFTDGSKEEFKSELYGRWYHSDLGWRNSGTKEEVKSKLKQAFDRSGKQQHYEVKFQEEQAKYLNKIQPYISTLTELDKLDTEGYWKKFLNRIYGEI